MVKGSSAKVRKSTNLDGAFEKLLNLCYEHDSQFVDTVMNAQYEYANGQYDDASVDVDYVLQNSDVGEIIGLCEDIYGEIKHGYMASSKNFDPMMDYSASTRKSASARINGRVAKQSDPLYEQLREGLAQRYGISLAMLDLVDGEYIANIYNDKSVEETTQALKWFFKYVDFVAEKDNRYIFCCIDEMFSKSTKKMRKSDDGRESAEIDDGRGGYYSVHYEDADGGYVIDRIYDDPSMGLTHVPIGGVYDTFEEAKEWAGYYVDKYKDIGKMKKSRNFVYQFAGDNGTKMFNTLDDAISGLNLTVREQAYYFPKVDASFPKFTGFLGPMYNGTDDDGNTVIRYESQGVYDSYWASTKKSIHDMISQVRQNNNSLTKSRVDLGITKAKSYDVMDAIKRMKEDYFQKHYSEYKGNTMNIWDYKSLVNYYATKYEAQGYSHEEAVIKSISFFREGGLGRIPQSVTTVADLMFDIREILRSSGVDDEELISNIQEYIMDHTFVNENGDYVFEGDRDTLNPEIMM